jgi:hypothetical protein
VSGKQDIVNIEIVFFIITENVCKKYLDPFKRDQIPVVYAKRNNPIVWLDQFSRLNA